MKPVIHKSTDTKLSLSSQIIFLFFSFYIKYFIYLQHYLYDNYPKGLSINYLKKKKKKSKGSFSLNFLLASHIEEGFF